MRSKAIMQNDHIWALWKSSSNGLCHVNGKKNGFAIFAETTMEYQKSNPKKSVEGRRKNLGYALFYIPTFFCTSVRMNEVNSSFRQHLRKRSETHLPCPYVLLYKRVSILLDVFIKDALDGATFVYYLKK